MNRQHGAKDLLLNDSVGLGNFGKKAGTNKISTIRNRTFRLKKFRPFLLPYLEVSLDSIALRLGIDCPNIGVLVQRISDNQVLHPRLQLSHHLLFHTFLNQKPGTRAAHVPLIEEDSVDDPLHRLVDRGILKNNIGRFTPEFEGQLGRSSRKGLLDRFPDLR